MLSTINISFDFIILSETWLTFDLNFVLNGYCTIKSLGEIYKYDGATIFVKDKLRINNIEKKIITNCNSIAICINYKGTQIMLTAIYRTPSSNINNFIMSLHYYIEYRNLNN